MTLQQTLDVLYGDNESLPAEYRVDRDSTKTPVRRKYGRKAMKYPPDAETDPQLAKQLMDQRIYETQSKYARQLIERGKPGHMIDIDPDGMLRTRTKQKGFDPTKTPLRLK